jgi:hypothetical protein
MYEALAAAAVAGFLILVLQIAGETFFGPDF